MQRAYLTIKVKYQEVTMEQPEAQVQTAHDIRVVWRCLGGSNNHHSRCDREERHGVWGPPQPLNFGQPVMYKYCDQCGKYRLPSFPDSAVVSDDEAAKTAEVINGCAHWCISCGKVQREGLWRMLPGGPLRRFNGRLSYENGRLFIGEPEPSGAHCPDCPDPLVEKK